MSNGNGYWTKWLVGILWALIITVITTIGTNLIASDKDSRARDIRLEDKCVQRYELICEKLNISCQKQSDTNQQILVALAELKTLVKR